MPVSLDRERAPVETDVADARCLTIGLVNNMPDPTLQATERQFVALLGAAAEGITVRLRPYALPDVPRTEWGRDYVTRFYARIGDLWTSRVDGLIVTGTEPHTPNLRDEPYWGSLTQLLEWAERHTYSTVWSCLATHAALLYLDGFHRRPLDEKRFGVFECARVGEHPLTAGAPARMRMPHSRWNEVAEDALEAGGYRVLTRSVEAGADAFVRQGRSLFVFFLGHPEYEAHSLMLEYRRDIRRFLLGERDTYPGMPHGYFDADTVAALDVLRARAFDDRREETLTQFPTALATARVTNTWRESGISIYRNWLQYICGEKARLLGAAGAGAGS